VTNTAQATTGDPGCPAAARCSGTTTVTDNSAPNLSINKISSVAIAGPSISFTFTVQASNSGPVASTNPTTVVDTIPTGVTVTALTAGAGFTCTPSSALPLVGNGTTSTVSCVSTAGVAAGTVNATVVILTVTKTGTASVTNTAQATTGDPGCPAAVRCTGTSTVATPPDLTPNFTFGTTAFPSPLPGPAESRFVVMNINEINGVTTSGQVRFNVPVSVGFLYEFDSTLTSVDVGGFPESVDNGNWEMRLVPAVNPTTMVFTLRNATTTPPAVPSLDISGNTRSRIALKTTPTLPGTKANVTINIVAGSGGETKVDNNNVVLSQSVQR
jgi:Domain of unknown function DUF11